MIPIETFAGMSNGKQIEISEDTNNREQQPQICSKIKLLAIFKNKLVYMLTLQK